MEIRHRRDRHVLGLTGDLTLTPTEYACRACGEALIPADEMWALGPGGLSPELSRVLAAGPCRHPLVRARGVAGR